jgi:hypothetical protein
MGNKIIDKLCDLFFRPIIRTSQQGADTIVYLAIENKDNHLTGNLFKSRKIKKVSSSIKNHSQKELLKKQTQEFIANYIPQ